jgi:hypothetical protein
MKEIDFDPATMEQATAADIFRMWKRLWGDRIIPRGGLELVPAWSHKPNDEGSTPSLASNEVADVENQKVGDALDGKERPANSTSAVQRAATLPDARDEEPAAPATELAEVTTQGE